MSRVLLFLKLSDFHMTFIIIIIIIIIINNKLSYAEKQRVRDIFRYTLAIQGHSKSSVLGVSESRYTNSVIVSEDSEDTVTEGTENCRFDHPVYV